MSFSVDHRCFFPKFPSQDRHYKSARHPPNGDKHTLFRLNERSAHKKIKINEFIDISSNFH